MNSLLVETQGLGVSFGGVHAVNSVDFRLERGELRCLIGPNGAGKSSFFRLLCGQYKPTRGSVKIKGKSIDGLQSYQIARLGLGIKTQVPSVFDGLSVEENIWLSARRVNSSREAATAVKEVMDTVRLSPIAGNQVGALSHGQRQWVELGIVMATRPDLILLDEPAAGMSDEEVKRTAELIKAANQKCALIVVEHDMEFIRMIAKTVTVFNRGTVLVEDTVDIVLNDERVKDVYLGKDLEMKG
ncbi:ATP-binding cassette domain-containing protein [Noviherbaspirillum cavernae]|uniref:ATP-binding cassette domain-containing protein n=1 Tax=Noviherbaspirillum cavernae TaxID=2320862 RepID=A0A418WVP9_9BURK|nr:ATP-binding cassette domain-containing protein [Noviherbaspirillum cavernae]RJF96804.1 ATP-binding cassette domain-containing protein [Noviherbaspirillum cavernae]